MKKRGAGWIPDYPDQSDYTLEKDSKKLSKQVQSQGGSASIESLAEKICDALVFFEEKTKDPAEKISIETIRESIETEILGGVDFVTVDFHDVFKAGSVDSEILRIQLYLSTLNFYREFFLNQTDSVSGIDIDVTNTTLDQETLKIVQGFLEGQFMYAERYGKNVTEKESICFDDIICLKSLASIVSQRIEPIQTVEYWLQYLGDKKEDDIKIFFENLAKTEEGSTQRPYYVYLTQLAINLLRLSSNLDWLNNSSKEIKLIQGILENLKNYFDILERFNFASKQSEPLPIKGLMETLVEKIEILLSFDSSTNSKKPSEQDFKDIIQEIYKLNIPQIPPQFFERKEIILEMPIHIDLFKIILEHLTGKVGKKMVVTFNTDNPEEPTIRRTKSHVWVDVPFSLDKYLSKDDCLSRQLYALVNPIVHIVAEILMPLGFGSKLSDSVEKALQKIENLLSEKNNLQSEEIQRKEEIRKLMSEALEQQGGALPKDVSSNVDDLRLLDMATSTLQKISSNLSQYMDYGWKFNAENSNCKDIVQESNWYFLSGDCRLVSLIEKIKKIEENNEKIEENQRLLLKPEQPIFQYVSKGNASNSHKQIQFPIGQELREKIANLQAKSKSPAIPSSYTEEVKQDKCVPDPNNVYLALPRFVDLSYCFSPVEDQGSLNSCTAHAGISLIEYAQYKITGTYTDVSPLFLYKVTRNLMKKEGDSGASMRDTMKAMVAFGVCPEEHWNYNEADFDQEPDAFCYSFAESFKALKYFRLDYGTISKSTLLAQVKVLLASEIPCAFGFTLYSSVYEDSNFELGHIPLPTSRDKVVGGHVVVAVGYHDRKIIKKSNGDQFEGALLIRNSWGSRWGQGGYGWMPYEYVTKGLTADWWSLLKAEWLASGSFGAGASAWDRDKGGDGRHQ